MGKKILLKDYIDYEKEGYLSLWLCNTASKDDLFRYVEMEYDDDDDEDEKYDESTIDFQMGLDFYIVWYDEDFFEASHRGNMRGWDLLTGHSRIESIMPVLKQEYSDVMDGIYNSVIIFYDFKYDGRIKEVKNEQYGYFKFIGAFEYQ